MSPEHLPDTYEGRLDHIIEEASEVIKAVIKIKRFGLKATDPNTGKSYDNLIDLYDEVQDVRKAFDNFSGWSEP